MSAFVELNPTLTFKTDGLSVMVPVRGGLIF